VLAGAEARGDQLDVETWTTPEGVVEPNDANRALYDAGYERQMELLAAARPLWHTRAGLAMTGDEK
jgi:xylulokinase/erythritol kinase